MASVSTPRAAWKGTLQLGDSGLVRVPVKLDGCFEKKLGPEFHEYTNTGTEKKPRFERLSRPRAIPGGTLDQHAQVFKGYEMPGSGEVVIIAQHEINKLDPKEDEKRILKVDHAVSLAEVDPIYFCGHYYIYPDRGGEDGYAVLVASLNDTKKALIGRVIMKTLEYVCVVRARGKMLVCSQLHYPEALKDASKVEEQVAAIKVAPTTRKLAKSLIEQMTTPFDPAAYTDKRAAGLWALVNGKGSTLPSKEQVGPDLIAALEAEAASRKKAKVA